MHQRVRLRAPSALLLACLALCLIGCDDDADNASDNADATTDAASDAIGGDIDGSSSDAEDGLDGQPDTDTTDDARAGDASLDIEDEGPPAPFPPETMTADEAMAAADLFIGTGGLGFGYASLTPAAQTPFGMIKLGPDTTNNGSHPRFMHFSGYHFDDGDVRGFSHTHFVGTGAVDYGNIRVLPTRTAEGAAPRERFTAMDKESEEATPGYYAVDLPEISARAELTASDHGGVHRYRFDGGVDGRPGLFFATAASIEEEGAQASVTGWEDGALVGSVTYRGGYVGRSNPFTLHFVATIEPEPSEIVFWNDDGLDAELSEGEGVDTGAALWFEDPGEGEQLEVVMRIGLSYVDADQAALHHGEEVAGRTLEEVLEATEAKWREKFARVRIGGTDPETAEIFYTALYNVYRMPTLFGGLDGRYPGIDAEIHTADGFEYHSDLSLWDTFRTFHPWLILADPAEQEHMLRSLDAMRQDGGYYPRWPAALSYTNGMIGTSADMVVAESALKGIEGIDYDEAFDNMFLVATQPIPPGHDYAGRNGVREYVELGWLPSDEYGTSVSRLLEYAWADGALAELATWLGRDEEAAELRERSRSYRNVYHEESGFFRGRKRDGTFDLSFSAGNVYMDGSSPYTEGSAWHWRFYGLHDPTDFAALFGGPDALGDVLETFFSRSALGREEPINTLLPDVYYWHGNEPTIHAAYLFQEAGRYDRLAHWVREIQTRIYGAGPDGLPGNDDGGTMSTWYLFSALGLYPVAGTDRYLLGSPLVPYAEVDGADGETLVIEARGASTERRFVGAVSLDGEALDLAAAPRGVIRHEALRDATLSFEMRDTPSQTADDD